MKTAIVIISGFRESEQASSGTERLHGMVTAAFSPLAKIYDLRPWDHDMKGLARKMSRDGMTEAIIIGYSWGGGFGAQQLAKTCQSVSLRVPLMLLCDAVYRPQWLPSLLPANVLALRSIIPGSARIHIPENVERVAGVYQTMTIPKGHAYKMHGGTKYGGMRKLDYPHTEIDDAPEWRKLVTDELERYFFRP